MDERGQPGSPAGRQDAAAGAGDAPGDGRAGEAELADAAVNAALTHEPTLILAPVAAAAEAAVDGIPVDVAAAKAAEPAPVLEYAPAPEARWHVGTLTYTAAGLIALFTWLLWGDFAWSMKERSVQSVVLLLLKKFQSSDRTAGLLIGSIPAAIGVVLVPIISYRSDRHRGPWGRRIPYLILTTPIAALGMVGLAFSPVMGRAFHGWMGGRSPGLNPSILIFFGLFWTMFEFGTLAANSVFGGLINDVVPQPLLGRFYGLFRALSLIAGMIFNYWLLGKAEAHYVWLFLGIGILYGGGFTMMCLKVKEGDYPPPPPAPGGIHGGAAAGFFSAVSLYLRECFTTGYYLWVFLFLTVSTMAFVPVNLFSVFFAKSLNMDMNLYGAFLALTYSISLVMAYFLGWIADRFHPLRVGLVTLAVYAVATLWGGLVIHGTTTFAVAFVAHGVLSGTFFTTTASLGQRLFPRAKFAQFWSASLAIGGIGNVVLGPAMGQVLDRSGHIYRYTFLASFALTVLSLLSGWVVYVKFKALGGPDTYVAPMCDDAATPAQR